MGTYPPRRAEESCRAHQDQQLVSRNRNRTERSITHHPCTATQFLSRAEQFCAAAWCLGRSGLAACHNASLVEIYTVAPIWKRVTAWLIDLALMFALVLVGWIALTLVLAKRGQTPGKALLGLRVVMPDGEPLPSAQLITRELLLKQLVGVVTFELSTILGAGQLLWDRRPWWDRVGHWVVVLRLPNAGIHA